MGRRQFPKMGVQGFCCGWRPRVDPKQWCQWTKLKLDVPPTPQEHVTVSNSVTRAPADVRETPVLDHFFDAKPQFFLEISRENGLIRRKHPVFSYVICSQKMNG